MIFFNFVSPFLNFLEQGLFGAERPWRWGSLLVPRSETSASSLALNIGLESQIEMAEGCVASGLLI